MKPRNYGRWTREVLREKAIEWMGLYGEPPRYTDWDPSVLRDKAIKKSQEANEAWARWARFNEGDWPSRMAVESRFGTFRGLLEDIGVDPQWHRKRDYTTGHWRNRTSPGGKPESADAQKDGEAG